MKGEKKVGERCRCTLYDLLNGRLNWEREREVRNDRVEMSGDEEVNIDREEE